METTKSHTRSTSCSHDHQSCVRLVPIFNHLDDLSMDKISTKIVHRTYEKGEYLFHEGDADIALYVVNSGKVRMFHINESGKEQLYRILNPGDFMGEWTLFNPGQEHDNYAQAISKSRICMIRQEDFSKLLQEYPNISVKLLTEMSQRLHQSQRQTATVSLGSVTERLAMYLTDLVTDFDIEEPVVKLKIPRKDLASYLGTTPETISRKFRELEEKAMIKQINTKTIKLLDIDSLLFYED